MANQTTVNAWQRLQATNPEVFNEQRPRRCCVFCIELYAGAEQVQDDALDQREIVADGSDATGSA